MSQAKSSAAVQKTRSPSIRERLIVSLTCLVLGAVVGGVLPMAVFYVVHRVWITPGAQDWSVLAAIIVSLVTAGGGALAGLIAGAGWPNKIPAFWTQMAITCLLVGEFVYWCMISPEPSLFAMIIFPSAMATGLMALGCWCLGDKSFLPPKTVGKKR